MRTARRIIRLLVQGAAIRSDLVDEMRDDPAVADDGLIAVAAIGTVVVGLTTFHWLPTVIAPLATPLLALFVSFVLRLVSRIAGNQVTFAETTAVVTLTSLPLVLIPIPFVGGLIGPVWWLFSGILLLGRVTLAGIDNAALVTLLSHALSIGAILGFGFAVQSLL